MDRREQLIQVCIKFMNDKGYNGVSLNDIAKEVGISKSTLFHYYANKEDLFNDAFLKCKKDAADFFTQTIKGRKVTHTEIIEQCVEYALSHKSAFLFMLNNEKQNYLYPSTKEKGFILNKESISIIKEEQKKKILIDIPAEMLLLAISDIICDSYSYLVENGKVNNKNKKKLIAKLIQFIER